MTWNYRVIRHEGDFNTWLAIHEVFYDGDEPTSCTEKPIDVRCREDEGVEALGAQLDMMRAALAKPVLDESKFDPHARVRDAAGEAPANTGRSTGTSPNPVDGEEGAI